MRVVLASASPRRVELLRSLTPEFDIAPADVDEKPFVGESPIETAERLALAKARVIQALCPDAVVIAGDTVVAVGEQQLAKPLDRADAQEMLATLSGREHKVITGIAVLANGVEHIASDTTRVRFRRLTDEEISTYVATGEPMDKAGAYAIQGGAKGFVESVEGSISNVIGLPLEVLGPILARLA